MDNFPDKNIRPVKSDTEIQVVPFNLGCYASYSNYMKKRGAEAEFREKNSPYNSKNRKKRDKTMKLVVQLCILKRNFQ